MFKFLVVLVISFVITQLLNSFFLEKKHADLEAKKKEIIFEVIAPNGMVGCLSKEKFFEAKNYLAQKNFAQVEEMIKQEICFFFKKGAQLEALEDTCLDNDDNELFPFKPLEFAILQPYLPCGAVKKIN
jgi:hypothetical protein